MNRYSVVDQRRIVAAVLGGAAPAAFAPTDVGGLVLWLKADAGTFQDAAKTTPATANTHPIGAWADQSGSGNDVTQAVAGLKPILATNRIGSLPGVYFDGQAAPNGDTLVTAAVFAMKPCTVFCVASCNDLANYRAFIGSDGNAFEFRHSNAGSGSAVLQALKQGVTVIGSGTGTLTNDTVTLVEMSYGSAGAFDFVINGTTGGSGTNNQTWTEEEVFIGSNKGIAEFFKGDLYEIAIYNSVLSAGDRTKVRNYLSTRWSLGL